MNILQIQFITFAVVSCVTCIGMRSIDFFADNTSGLLGCRNEATSGKGTGSSTKQAEVLTKEEEDLLWEKELLGGATPQSL